MTHREAKGHIRAFMQAHYTDERLAQLLAHAQEGKLVFGSCCCFIGVATANHSLTSTFSFSDGDHYRVAEQLRGANEAEEAYHELCGAVSRDDSFENGRDAARRRILIPMVRAEMRRRDREAIAERAVAVPATQIAAALVSAHMVAK